MRGFLAFCLAMVIGGVAQAQDGNPAEPTDADRQKIAECVASAPHENVSPLGCIGMVSDPCLAEPDNESTPMMAACLEREAAIWDERLNDDYQALIDRLDKTEAAKLRDSQRAWLAVRDATCDIEGSFWQGGTGYGGAIAGCMLRETGARDISLVALRTYLDQ
ncbi:Uncharacterized conserved protein YecT, DUF1311 family [Pleomorphomonas diazotrophica]|nr:lysozyme inhibitor LprI family protein [Pleomorphomonas diazotrophica]SFM37747.1 Uncharacterized conserved protein YecT, DUF1311 family [Pleomorphomonas diazotrophica]